MASVVFFDWARLHAVHIGNDIFDNRQKTQTFTAKEFLLSPLE